MQGFIDKLELKRFAIYVLIMELLSDLDFTVANTEKKLPELFLKMAMLTSRD